MLKYFQLYENFGKAIQRFKMTRRPSSQPGSSPGTPYLPIFGTIPSRSALVKVRTKSQALEAAWPGNSIKAPRLWFFSGHQNPSSSGCLAESHVRLALIKHQTKSQTLQGAWQSHALKALVKKSPNVKLCLWPRSHVQETKSQGFQTLWHSEAFKTPVQHHTES